MVDCKNDSISPTYMHPCYIGHCSLSNKRWNLFLTPWVRVGQTISFGQWDVSKPATNRGRKAGAGCHPLLLILGTLEWPQCGQAWNCPINDETQGSQLPSSHEAVTPAHRDSCQRVRSTVTRVPKHEWSQDKNRPSKPRPNCRCIDLWAK